MARYIIEGGKRLSGTVKVSGNKNSIFPCLAAALLTDKEVILHNIPSISDVDICLQILNKLGVKTKKEEDIITIKAKGLSIPLLPKDLTRKLRGSIVFIGSLLGRLGKVEFCHPGGDIIGKRSIDVHLEGFKQLGYSYKILDLDFTCYKKQSLNQNREVFLDEPSVTATENLILVSVLGTGKTILKNCAKEPHVVDLCQMLLQMGADISGVGESTLVIQAVPVLGGTEYKVGPDYLEAGAYAVATGITGGEITIENFSLEDMEPLVNPLKKLGLVFEQLSENSVKVRVKGLKAAPVLKTNVWPGFPTDMMSLIIVLATQAQGVSLLHDWMFESRMFFVDKLISMGGNITIADPHRVVIYGPTKLAGKELETPDIRAGMALVLAALVAKGESVINRAELIERGYDKVVEKLSSLGAEIKKTD